MKGKWGKIDQKKWNVSWLLCLVSLHAMVVHLVLYSYSKLFGSITISSFPLIIFPGYSLTAFFFFLYVVFPPMKSQELSSRENMMSQRLSLLFLFLLLRFDIQSSWDDDTHATIGVTIACCNDMASINASLMLLLFLLFYLPYAGFINSFLILPQKSTLLLFIFISLTPRQLVLTLVLIQFCLVLKRNLKIKQWETEASYNVGRTEKSVTSHKFTVDRWRREGSKGGKRWKWRGMETGNVYTA